MKQCTKCGNKKEMKYFCKDKSKKDGLYSICKQCKKEYKENNKEKIRQDSIKYKKDHEHVIKKQNKEYYKSPTLYNSIAKYRKEIELYEEIKESPDGNLMCKCAYCGEGFEPTKLQVQNRISSVNGRTKGESRLYCSNQCKGNCPIYRKHLYSNDVKTATSREVQPELRQLAFARDDYTCQKCNTHRDNLEVGIHCHHREGILGEPLQSADMDMCITLCKDCHKEVHGIDGCGYHELRCIG